MAGILSIQFEPVLNEIDKNLKKVKTIIENFVKVFHRIIKFNLMCADIEHVISH